MRRAAIIAISFDSLSTLRSEVTISVMYPWVPATSCTALAQVAKKESARVGNHEPDHARSLALEHARGLIGRVTETPDCGADAFFGRGTDIAAAVDDARHGHDGDAGFPRDVGDGGAGLAALWSLPWRWHATFLPYAA